MKNPNFNVDQKIKYRATSYVLLGDQLYKKGVDDTLLRCLGEIEEYLALAKVHEGNCGSHQAGEYMKWVLYRKEYYWPTVLKGCMNYAKSYGECQKHGPIQQVPTRKYIW